MNIVQIIEALAATSGKLEKIDILSQHSESLTVRKVFYYAYSPKFVYGIKKVTPVPEGLDPETLDDSNINDLESLLLGLHKRDFTGNAAKAAVSALLSRFDAASQDIIINIIKRDLRCGMDTSINKAIPNLIEPDPAYMRCSTLEGGKLEEFNKDYFYSQIKADGMYLNLHCGNGRIFAETRNGIEFPIHKFTDFYNRLLEVYGNSDTGVVFCGEVVMTQRGLIMPREASNGITNKITKGGEVDFNEYGLVFYAWDIIPEEKFVQKGKYDVPYRIRLEALTTNLESIGLYNFRVIETKIVHSWDEAIAHYLVARGRGEEGTVIKCSDAPWKDGTSPYQIKMKAEVEIDLRIDSLNPGKGKNEKYFGSIRAYSEDGLVEGNIAGISDDLRKDIFENFDSYRGKIITVRSNNLTLARDSKVHKLFLPRYIIVREDKNVADDLQRIKEIFESVL